MARPTSAAEVMNKASELVKDAETVIAEAEKSKEKADAAVARSIETIEKAQVVLEKAEMSLAENDETIVLLKENLDDLQSLQEIDKSYIDHQYLWIIASFITTILLAVCLVLERKMSKSNKEKLHSFLRKISTILLAAICFLSFANFYMRLSYQENYLSKEIEIMSKMFNQDNN